LLTFDFTGTLTNYCLTLDSFSPGEELKSGIIEIKDTIDKLVAGGQYVVQAKDGLSIQYTLNGVTATAERFLLGTQEQVEEAANLRGLLMLVESSIRSVLEKVFESSAGSLGKDPKMLVSQLASALTGVSGTSAVSKQAAAAPLTAASKPDDYSAYSLEDVSQFSMAWTTFEGTYRKGNANLEEYCKSITDPQEATRQFWPMLSSTALPYNLLVLQKLTQDEKGSAELEKFKNKFGAAWLPVYTDLLNKGKLYGIDMTIFSQAPQTTERFTPITMTLLEMDDQKNLSPIAVYVADPAGNSPPQVYTESSPAWIYGLLAVKTSLTVYGIYLGHVYALHMVTAAMQMVTLNVLPPTNIIYQLLEPQSHYTIVFDLLLLIGWSRLAPPTSISDAGKFLNLGNAFSANHGFFSTDPAETLKRMNLDAADFTSIDDQPWSLYPNVQMMLKIWKMTADYVSAVVDAGYQDDGTVKADTKLADWINAAGTNGPGNIAGLPPMDSKKNLKDVVTSVLYRITFHGIGRLRSVGSPAPLFAPNYPMCLQSSTIPDPTADLPTSELLKTYLPNTGTLGAMVTFLYGFSFTTPYVPMIPEKGVEDDLFFDQEAHPTANQALIEFREGIQDIIKTLQPDWVQIGQWPRNIEL
jgi:hypothetical protein